MSGPTLHIVDCVQGVPGTRLYQAVDSGGVPVPGVRLAVVGLMHGNEPVGGPVLDRIQDEAVTQLKAGAILAVRANLAAESEDKRHTAAGLDMNRLWDRRTLQRLAARDAHTLCYEERRALELAPLIQDCDAILDLHSTSRPAAAFLLFRDDQAHALLARKLGVHNLVTGLHENAILPGGLCSNTGLEAGENHPRLGFTFEAGQHQDPDNMARAWSVTHRLLFELGIWARAPLPTLIEPEVYEVIQRFRQSEEGSEPFRFVGYEGGEKGAGRRGPQRKLHSFERIEADEVITRRGRQGVIRAQAPFTMLMPAPDTGPGTDLYYVAHPRHGGLIGNERLSDEAARAQAVATERMLDLLADDDFVKGTSWVSYDGRQLLDLCASVVGRTHRLPAGHPHRRLTIVGRGESGGERERRAGQRYRQAMRHAVADGLPIERYQVMRGAPLRWLDSLTADGMYAQVQRREKLHPMAEPVKLRVSLRQPHTVSMAVAGDLDLALQTGDTRYVRVALLIEAASVEPIGEQARVRVVRAGILSSRREVLRAARDLLVGLRDEHDHLMERGELAKMPGVRQAMGPDGAIWATADAKRLSLLHNALYRVQLQSWGHVLRAELVEPARLRSPAAVGQWLAKTMAATGIYDADALRAMVIRRTEKEWRADPRLLAQFIGRLERGATDPLKTPSTPKLRPLPRQPLEASTVTADDLERWVGWKRFVRGVKVVPDTRGKDVDLAFSEGAIRKRMARWFGRAQAMGAEAPGDVLVVVAGDGLNPKQEGMTAELLKAHRDLLRDSNVHYLRIQHAQATHLSWYKDFLATLQERPAGHSVAVQWEAEHGATVNVVMLARRDRDDISGVRAWSLEGWKVEACGVILADLGGRGSRDSQVGMFTESGRRQVGLSQELVHFGRAHCGGLLKQAGWRVRDSRGAPPPWELERAIVRQIARWIERTRAFSIDDSTSEEAAAALVAQRLGLVDPRLARALAQERIRDEPAQRAAEALWASVPEWPVAGMHERTGSVDIGVSC